MDDGYPVILQRTRSNHSNHDITPIHISRRNGHLFEVLTSKSTPEWCSFKRSTNLGSTARTTRILSWSRCYIWSLMHTVVPFVNYQFLFIFPFPCGFLQPDWAKFFQFSIIFESSLRSNSKLLVDFGIQGVIDISSYTSKRFEVFLLNGSPCVWTKKTWNIPTIFCWTWWELIFIKLI